MRMVLAIAMPNGSETYVKLHKLSLDENTRYHTQEAIANVQRVVDLIDRNLQKEEEEEVRT